MNNISVDISNKIDGSMAGLLLHLSILAEQMKIPFVVVGATARDILFEMIHGIKANRATYDVDLAVSVSSWGQFQAFEQKLQSSGAFSKELKRPYRFRHESGTFVDILPCGDLEDLNHNIRWPSTQVEMTMLGFAEAFASAKNVCVSPYTDVRVISEPALTVLKLISWNEGHPYRTNDAKDIDFILSSYLEIGNEQRIFGTDRDITGLQDFDMAIAGPRLLGRDIAKIVNVDTQRAMMDILERETEVDGYGKLVRDMMERKGDFYEVFAEKLRMLTHLKLGILDGKH